MNIFHSLLIFLQDFWNLLEEFIEHIHPDFIQDINNNTNDNTNDDIDKTI